MALDAIICNTQDSHTSDAGSNAAYPGGRTRLDPSKCIMMGYQTETPRCNAQDSGPRNSYNKQADQAHPRQHHQQRPERGLDQTSLLPTNTLGWLKICISGRKIVAGHPQRRLLQYLQAETTTHPELSEDSDFVTANFIQMTVTWMQMKTMLVVRNQSTRDS